MLTLRPGSTPKASASKYVPLPAQKPEQTADGQSQRLAELTVTAPAASTNDPKSCGEKATACREAQQGHARPSSERTLSTMEPSWTVPVTADGSSGVNRKWLRGDTTVCGAYAAQQRSWQVTVPVGRWDGTPQEQRRLTQPRTRSYGPLSPVT